MSAADDVLERKVRAAISETFENTPVVRWLPDNLVHVVVRLIEEERESWHRLALDYATRLKDERDRADGMEERAAHMVEKCGHAIARAERAEARAEHLEAKLALDGEAP